MGGRPVTRRARTVRLVVGSESPAGVDSGAVAARSDWSDFSHGGVEAAGTVQGSLSVTGEAARGQDVSSYLSLLVR